MNPTPPALSTFVPPLPEALVANLATLGIKTAPDLIFAPLATLMRQLPPGSITYAELMQHVAHVTEAFAGPVITGDKLLAEADSRVQLGSVQSGLPALDALLDHNSGGESSGRVVEISGSGGSGKTALALHIVLNHLESHQPNAALWIDTTGDLAPARLTALASHSHEGPAAEDILSRLNIVSVFDIEAVVRTIEALDSDSAPQVPRFRIVVLDTVTALLGPRLSGLSSQGHAEMTLFMRLLRATAQKLGMCILVLNEATAAGRPALGPSFTFLTDATLWLARALGRDRELRTAEVIRSRVSAHGTRCEFRIRDGAVIFAT